MKLGLRKLIVGIITVIVVIIISIIFINTNKKTNGKYSKLKNALSNTFFYLEHDDYTDISNISDVCKISLIYDTSYIKSDYTVYDSDKKIKGYTKNNVLKSIKSILGDSATINFDINELNSYDFLSSDKCIYNNKISGLTYDSNKNVLYKDDSESINRYVVVKWNDEKENSDYLDLKAKALMIVKNEKYDVYKDNNMEFLIGSYDSLSKAKSAALKNIDKSYQYEFKFKKENSNYIWIEFHRKTYKDIIID